MCACVGLPIEIQFRLLKTIKLSVFMLLYADVKHTVTNIKIK